MANILGIGQSALNAAQIGLATTGHNIANAATPGYNRQMVVQDSAGGQDMGGGFIGKGTNVVAVKRVYNEFLQNQVQSSQTSKGMLDNYYGQIKLIDNMLSDPTVGVSPALQDFFTGVQTLSSDPNSAAARQSMLSGAETLAARFQTMDSQLTEIREGVNSQIRTAMEAVNTYARQISDLNTQIERAMRNSTGQEPNDLLDERDQAILQLAKEVKVSIVKQGNPYDVYIGNGQSLVINSKTYDLVQMQSPYDSGRMEIGYVNQQGITMLEENSFAGGRLAGLMDFRSQTLDQAQNTLGRMAIVMADAFNRQHMLGQDQNGTMGQAFFNVGQPMVTSSTDNTGTGEVTATLSNASQLTTSDYQIRITQEEILPGQPLAYSIMRLSDGVTFGSSPVDGVTLNFSGPLKVGDQFRLRPTVNGADADLGISVAIKDKSLIAAAAPIRTTAATTNTGTGRISEGSVNPGLPVNAELRNPATITFTSPTTYTVSGTSVLPPPPATEFTYTPGADISFNGWTMKISGTPAPGDSFFVAPNTGGVGDGRNAVRLGALQTASLVDGKTTIQGAYSEMVNQLGNKTRELEVTSSAATKLAELATRSRDAESAVNLDEEAANLLRYQQAYQAAGKVMKTAGELFDLLLTLG